MHCCLSAKLIKLAEECAEPSAHTKQQLQNQINKQEPTLDDGYNETKCTAHTKLVSTESFDLNMFGSD